MSTCFKGMLLYCGNDNNIKLRMQCRNYVKFEDSRFDVSTKIRTM